MLPRLDRQRQPDHRSARGRRRKSPARAPDGSRRTDAGHPCGSSTIEGSSPVSIVRSTAPLVSDASVTVRLCALATAARSRRPDRTRRARTRAGSAAPAASNASGNLHQRGRIADRAPRAHRSPARVASPTAVLPPRAPPRDGELHGVDLEHRAGFRRQGPAPSARVGCAITCAGAASSGICLRARKLTQVDHADRTPRLVRDEADTRGIRSPCDGRSRAPPPSRPASRGAR